MLLASHINPCSLFIEPYLMSCQILMKFCSLFFTLPLKRGSIRQVQIAACTVKSRVCFTKHYIYLFCMYDSCANTTCLLYAALSILCLFQLLIIIIIIIIIIFIYLLQLGCYPVAVAILHVYKILNWLLLNLSREGYMRSM